MNTLKVYLVATFSICFFSVNILLGGYYEKFHLSKHSWTVITIAAASVLVILYILDIVSSFKKKEQ